MTYVNFDVIHDKILGRKVMQVMFSVNSPSQLISAKNYLELAIRNARTPVSAHYFKKWFHCAIDRISSPHPIPDKSDQQIAP